MLRRRTKRIRKQELTVNNMNEYTVDQLNEIAMKIIMHAGDCRNLVSNAIDAIANKKTNEKVDEILKKAEEQITLAHKAQTEVIQNSIMNPDQKFTVLFMHAQDTLMTIKSELYLTQNMIKLYRLK